MKKTLNLIAVVLMLSFLTGTAFAEKTDKWKNVPGLEKFENFRAIFLMDHISYDYNTDGSTMLAEHEAIKIFDKKALDKYGKIMRPFVKPDQAIVVEIARIIKPDGTIIDLEEKKEITFSNELGSKSKLLEDYVLMTLDFTAAQPGDVIEFKIVHYDKKPQPADYFFGISFINDENPILKSTLTVNMFADADKLKWYGVNLSDKLTKPEITSISGGKKYEWIFRDSPPLENQPNAPAFRDRASYIMLSTCPSWKNISKDYYRLFEKSIEPDEAIKKKVEELTNKDMKPMEKIFSLATFISEKGFLNMGFDTDRVRLYSPSKVLKTKTSTRINSSLLFISMLRAAGFEVWPVLVSDQKNGTVHEQIPTPYQFNKVIAKVKIDGDWKFIDASSPFNRQMNLYAGMEGRKVLPVTPMGSDFETTKITPPEENAEIVNSKAELSDDGSMGITLNLKETGTRKIFWESFLKMVPTKGSQKLVFAQLASLLSEDAKLIGYNRNEDPDSNVLEMEVAVMSDSYPTRSGNFWILKMPLFPPQKPKFAAMKAKERKFPVVLGGTSMEEKNFVISLPEGVKVKSLPKNRNFSNNVGSLKIECSTRDNLIEYKYSFKVKKINVPLDEYPELLKLYNMAFEAGKEVILLEKSAEEGGPTG